MTSAGSGLSDTPGFPDHSKAITLYSRTATHVDNRNFALTFYLSDHFDATYMKISCLNLNDRLRDRHYKALGSESALTFDLT